MLEYSRGKVVAANHGICRGVTWHSDVVLTYLYWWIIRRY